MNENETPSPAYCVAVEGMTGMERQYFESLNCAMTEYNRLVKFGRHAYFFDMTMVQE